MSRTIDAMQSRLDPRRFMTDARDTVKATAGKVKRLAQRSMQRGGADGDGPLTLGDMFHAARQNPIPVALAGVTATAVLVGAMKRSRGSTVAPEIAAGFPVPDRIQSSGSGRHRVGMFAGTCAALGCGALMAWRLGKSRAVTGPRPVADDTVDPFEPISRGAGTGVDDGPRAVVADASHYRATPPSGR
jgi:hypothetical protein